MSTSNLLKRAASTGAASSTAKAKAEAIRTQADADAYRISKLEGALSQAGEGYFRNQSLDSFNNLAAGPNNMIILDKDEIGNLGKIPAASQIWDKSKD